ncbi:aspartate aminotransferase family protein [Methylophaga sp. OBS1]|jgi:diaminobutyrate-2-oxoglutarate transaminase|uniref:aspartate aminotransferase family protein n=1 Tax=Methylophaga sp. OBS1 TaxID=2991933 RepID=UPI0019C54A71|nr:aspartate aminotransferase family protein [Methylophaga sp. OBS1]MBD3634053.1 aspartate aminotransferase family protein [Methylophaga sp.]MCX4191454.1 aspartate aminotransferase family protein [Methylophaga sp. OBS1]MCX4191602.1 aspartate aminotransferase family protein [Methylophaga sp. OBS1]
MSVFEQRESAIRAYCRVYPVVFDKARNARQRDEDGKEYIDFFAGAGVLNFGHNNERMTQAVVDYIQSGGVTHALDMMTTAKRRFMERFEKVVLKPRNMNHKMQFIGPTGTNAVEAAMKLARRVTARQEIVAFTRGFHGMTLGSLAATANRYFRGAAGVPLNHVSHYPFGCNKPCMGCESGCGLESIEHMRSLYRDTSSGVTPPAAFLLETVQAEGGVNVASKEWLQAVAALAKEVGALLIVDDIQVGMGRTGSFFSFDDMGIDPDIICLAKGLGGMGTPIAMNLIKPEVDEYWSPGEHTGTFRGQSISFVAGSEALSYFEDNSLMKEVHEKGDRMNDALAPLEQRYDQVQIRGRGMILGLDVMTGERAKAIVERCFEAGLLIAACGTGGRVVKLIPPLTIPDSDLEEGLKILVEITEKVMEEAA